MISNEAVMRACEAAGGQTKLARALRISPQAVDAWRRRRIPATRVLEVERVTGIPRWELRPDIYPDEEDPAWVYRADKMTG